MLISVVIPTLNAGKTIDWLLKSLESQTIIPDEIIIVDSQSSDETKLVAENHKLVRFYSIQRETFDHGGTRNFGFSKSTGDYVLFLTQDATPYDKKYVGNLISSFSDKSIAMAYGRQIANHDATYTEKFIRNFNYPPESCKKTKEDIEKLGIKTFFASDVCSAYRRTDFVEMNGFNSPAICNEDMLIAARFIHSGKSVFYNAQAKVYHSHKYSLGQEFKRNFDIGISLKQNETLLNCKNETNEGIKLFKECTSSLFQKKQYSEIFYFFLLCFCKFSGNRIGRILFTLFNNVINKCSCNQIYWNHYFRRSM